MDKNDVNYNKELNYFTFVLGYDLLNNMLSKSSTPENDISYDFCNNIASEFLKSEEYKNEKYSSYEILDKWIYDNRNYIEKEYKDFIFTRKVGNNRNLDNGVYVIDVGYRKNEPVALIEKKYQNKEKEYIIAIDYRINDNEISWGSGHYYRSKQMATNHFNRVLRGENLIDIYAKERERDSR